MKAERYLRRVDAYLDRLITAFEASANSADAEIQPGRKRLILHGVGKPTPEVAAIMREAPSIIEVVWRQAPYTSAELCAETDRIMERFPQILTGGPRNFGAGLEFGTLDRQLVEAEDPQAMLGTRYPVTIEYDGPVAF